MTALAVAVVSQGRAHDLNVFASRLAAKVGDHITVYLSWGHGLPVDDLIDNKELERYDYLSPTGKVTALKHEGESLQTNNVELKEEGVCQIVAVRKPYIYTVLANDDGEHGFKFKIGPKSAVKEGTVDYAMRWQAFAKALIVVGEPKSEAVKPAGLPIEIVPVEGPASWQSGRTLRYRLLYANKPLPYQEAWATRVGLLPHGTWCFAASADEEGIISVPVKEAGTWVVRMQSKKLAATKDRNDFDLDTLNATQTLEVQP
jgi:uncharacterized GH25 family protein